jgi:hypothetical protein
MTRASADWQMHTHCGVMHCFTERGIDRPGAKYDERADRRSWHSRRALLDETMPLASVREVLPWRRGS